MCRRTGTRACSKQHRPAYAVWVESCDCYDPAHHGAGLTALIESPSRRKTEDPRIAPPTGEQSPREELANSLTHGVGLVASIVGLAVLVGFASRFGNVWHVVSCSVFGATLIFQYATSTLYHGVWHPPTKRILRVLDHCAIFLLIAGTYTPFALVNLRQSWGWLLFAVIWGLALIGIVGRLGSDPRPGASRVAAPRALSRHGMDRRRRGGSDDPQRRHGRAGPARTRRSRLHRRCSLLPAAPDEDTTMRSGTAVVLSGSTFHYFAVLFYVVPI